MTFFLFIVLVKLKNRSFATEIRHKNALTTVPLQRFFQPLKNKQYNEQKRTEDVG